MHTAYHRRRAWEMRVLVAAAVLLLAATIAVAALLWQVPLVSAGAAVGALAQALVVRAIWVARP